MVGKAKRVQTAFDGLLDIFAFCAIGVVTAERMGMIICVHGYESFFPESVFAFLHAFLHIVAHFSVVRKVGSLPSLRSVVY